MARKRVIKIRPRAERARILAEAKAKGLSALQVEKRYGVSRWTFYGWKKREGSKGMTRAVARAKATGVGERALRAEIRAVLPGILREEIARALGSILGKRRARS